MSERSALRTMTVEEYIRFDEASQVRHEWPAVGEPEADYETVETDT